MCAFLCCDRLTLFCMCNAAIIISLVYLKKCKQKHEKKNKEKNIENINGG